MPRYVVERTFPEELPMAIDGAGVHVCLGVVERNAHEGVTRVHSYVSNDKRKRFCVFDAPSPEPVRKTAGRNELPATA